MKTTAVKIKSWVARYRATEGYLLGGVRMSQSSRFGSESDARLFLETALDINKSAGVKCEGDVFPSSLPPEIFAHCEGTWAQAIGGLCFGCKKKLTKKDAAEYAKRWQK